MKQIITLIFYVLPLLFSIQLPGQQSPPGCDGARFINEVFSSTMVSTVQYGENLNNGVPEALIMDIYEPEGDMLTDRPVIIFAHGGYFIFGSRWEMAGLCENFAKRGYVAATIDYRKLPGGTTLNSVNTVKAIVRTMQDMKAAVRYFREDRATGNVYRINPDFICVGGYSAGAFTALHTAYWDETDDVPAYMTDIVAEEGGFEGMSSDNLQFSSAVQAVIGHSGALVDTTLISQNEPPVILYHGAADNVVPIGHGTAGGAIVSDGSRIIHDKAELSGIARYYHPVQGGGHGDIFSGAFLNEYNEYLDSAAIVLESLYCSLAFTDTKEPAGEIPFFISPNPASSELTITFPNYSKLSKDPDIMLSDLSGRNFFQGKMRNELESIDLNTFPSGIYLLEIRSGEGRYVQKVLVRE